MTLTAAPVTGDSPADDAGPPPLPVARGEISAAVLDALRGPVPQGLPAPGAFPSPEGADPYGDDLHLALYVCYETHYRGFRGVDPAWEWDPGLLWLRGRAEEVFLRALRADTAGGDDVGAEMDALLVEPVPGTGLSHRMRDEADWWQMRELFVHRSVYHLKEADPHAWVIPRLRGRAKAGMVAVEYDEFGAGRGDRVHARLYADLMDGAGLDPAYLRYLDHVPAPGLAVVNMMSLFGLRRALRGALVGHFAAVETTSSPGSRRMAQALERLGAPLACTHFYAEHVEADAVHEQVVRRDVLGGLLEDEPELAADVVLGIQATDLLEERLGAHLTAAWDRGASSLRRPLPDGPGHGSRRSVGVG